MTPPKAIQNPTLPSPAIPPQALPSQAFPRNMSSAATKKATTDGGWQEIRKRYRYPSHWRSNQPSTNMVKPYAPYSRQSSYARVVQSKPSPPRSPTYTPGAYYYVSPHSPTRLRFPPSPLYPEWRGRCFKCCRTGHSVANCRFQRKCGKCWANGHIGTNCTKVGSATVAAVPRPVAKLEPGFDELLSDPMPYPQPLMPEGRPQKVDCFIERDEDYFLEMEALSRAVVVYNLGFKWELSVDTVANYAVKSGLVTKNDIQVSALPGSKYLIRLPMSVSVEAFLKATPYEAWEEGL